MAEGGEGEEKKAKGKGEEEGGGVREVPASSTSAWSSFLLAVDENPPKSNVIEGVSSWLSERGITDPRMLEGVSEADIDTNNPPKDLITKAFLKRTLRCVEVAQQAKRQKALNPVEKSPASGVNGGELGSAGDISRLFSVVGGDSSALALAQGILGGSKTLDISQRIENSALKGLPFHMQAEAKVWQQLEADSVAAAACVPPRVAFTYVDLTSKELLPLWLSPDAIGGKISMSGESEWCIDANASLKTLGQLGAALSSATQTPRFFRSLSQWSATFLRYSAVAIAFGQLTLPAVLTYLNLVYQIVEEEKSSGNSAFLAILYDDMLRRDIAKRVERRDPTLVLIDEVQKVNMQIMQAARTRLGTVLENAGITKSKIEPGTSLFTQSASASSVGQLAAESALAKQSAAANALRVKAEQAARSLASQQCDLDARNAAMSASGTKVEGKTWKSNRHRKAQKFFAQQRENRKGKGKGGKSGGKGQGGGQWQQQQWT
jgi:hypothetical protein